MDPNVLVSFLTQCYYPHRLRESVSTVFLSLISATTIMATTHVATNHMAMTQDLKEIPKFPYSISYIKNVFQTGDIFSSSCVICNLSLTPTATATDLPPAYSPTMHRRLVCQDRNFCIGEPAY